MRVGIFLQHFNTAGGGEKHIGVVAEYLSKMGHDVEIISFREADKNKIADKLHLDFSNIKLISYDLNTNPNELSEITANYDLFINATIFSNLINRSKYGIAMVYFPIVLTYRYPTLFKRVIKYFLEALDILKLININKEEKSRYFFINILRKIYKKQKESLQTIDYLKTYKEIWTNSIYSHSWIKKIYGMDSKVLYPPIEVDEFKPGVKEDIIISVGRFFPELYGHNKKQLQMIRFFKHAYDNHKELHKYVYHICGGLNSNNPEDKEYFESCVLEAKGYPIVLHPNIEFKDLKKLYSISRIFWHAAGFGEDPIKTPQVFEHFGITTVEAMSAGVVPIVIGRGGQPEIVKDGENGYLWLTEEKCIEKTMRVIKDSNNEIMMNNAIITSKLYSKDKMIEKTKEYLKEIL